MVEGSPRVCDRAAQESVTVKQVYIARNEADAKLACDILLQAGIKAVVRGDPLPVTTKPFPIVYVVNAAELDRAKELLGLYPEGDVS